MPVLSADFLDRFYRSIAAEFGASDEEAAIFARCFLLPDLRGHETQGAAYIPVMCRWLKEGIASFGVPVTVAVEGHGYAVLDGGFGLGQIVATRGMELAILKASTAGIGCVWLRNTNDFTMASNYSILALEKDFIGVAMSNGHPAVAPWGSRDPLFATNPLSVAVPAGAEPPIVLDMSTSSISHGQVVHAARDRRLLDSALLLDEHGHPTNDPLLVVLDPMDRASRQLGAILSSGPKGSGLAMIVEILAGILSGMSPTYEVRWPRTQEESRTRRPGQLLMAIDISKVMPLDEFKWKVDAFVRAVKASRPAHGFEEVILPGEQAHRRENLYRLRGVPIRDEDWDKIVAIATRLGIDASSSQLD